MIVALGSNMPGDYASSEALLEAAVRSLSSRGMTVTARSAWWRSAAWPDPSGPPYLNGVCLIETALDPAATLETLKAIERDFSREPAARNAPRTLDLDLIAYGRTISDHPALPHPRAHERLFVMGPLNEIAPDWVHPGLGKTAAETAGSASVGTDATPI